MKIALNILLAVCFGYYGHAQVLLKLSNDTLRPFTYNGGDEFNADAINQDSWDLTPWPRTNMGQFFTYEAGNTSIENGVAVFTLKQKDSLYTIEPIQMDSSFIRKRKLTLENNTYRMAYSAGIIISKQKYHYGLYELRFKVEEGKGVWPAFWFYGGNKNEEIDIFELKGEKNNKIHVDTHCPTGCDAGYKNKLGFNANWGGWMPVENYLHNGFNSMMLDWQPNELTWYINGYPLAYFKGQFPNPMNMYINTQVASKYSAFQPGPDTTTKYPNNFYVDYFRVWKNSEVSTNAITLQATNRMAISSRFVSDYKNRALTRSGLMYKKKKFNAEAGMLSLTLVPPHRLRVTVFGELNDPKVQIEVKGAFGTYTLKNTGAEEELALDKREKEVELVIRSGKKQYSQKLSLQK